MHTLWLQCFVNIAAQYCQDLGQFHRAGQFARKCLQTLLESLLAPEEGAVQHPFQAFAQRQQCQRQRENHNAGNKRCGRLKSPFRGDAQTGDQQRIPKRDKDRQRPIQHATADHKVGLNTVVPLDGVARHQRKNCHGNHEQWREGVPGPEWYAQQPADD